MSNLLGLVEGQTLDALPANARLNPQQTAQALEVSTGTLQIWRTTGRHNLPYIKIGGRVQYRVGDLREWLSRRTRTHTGQSEAVGGA